MNPMLLCHVAWMEKYSGEEEISGGHGYVRETGDGEERWNFKPRRGRMFGYATNTGINIGRLGAERQDNCVHPVDVVWTATRPEGGRVVVGWYRDAKVYRRLQPDPRQPDYSGPLWNIEAAERNCRRLEVEDRKLSVEANRPGGYPARRTWFADEYEYGKEIRLKIEQLFAEHPRSEEFDREQLDFAAEEWRKSFEPGTVPKPKGNKAPSSKVLQTKVYGRSHQVCAWVKDRAQGRCELCGKRSFRIENGQWYLEVHHVQPLAEKGKDVPDNTVALCPNCHRKAHYGEDKTAIRKQLKERVKRR